MGEIRGVQGSKKRGGGGGGRLLLCKGGRDMLRKEAGTGCWGEVLRNSKGVARGPVNNFLE